MVTHLFSEILVDGDIAILSVAGLGVKHPRQERMNRKVSPLHSVIKSTIDRHLFTKTFERFEQGGRFVILPRRFREEALLLVAQQIPHGYKSSGPNPAPLVA